VSAIGKADLLLPVVPGGPREWDASEALIERAMQSMPDDPTGLLLHPDAWAARQEIAAQRWLLIRNEAGNEPARSSESGRKETYFTYLGVERPWNGLDEVGAWLFDTIDPDNTEPTTAELVRSIIGTWQSLGRIEYISVARAKELSLAIFMKSRGRVDLFGMAQRKALV